MSLSSHLDCKGHISECAHMSGNLVNNSSITETQVTVRKEETIKSRVCIKTAEGHVQEVEFGVAVLCGAICKEMQSGGGCCMDNPISLHPLIKKNFLNFVLNYCRYHHVSGSVYKGSDFEEILLAMDENYLCELIYVAQYLQITSLIDLTYEAMVKKIESLSCFEELQRMLKCPDNVTEEEHLSWIKSLRYLFIERMIGKKEKDNLKKFEIVSKPRHHEDTRSIDDLLAFINGGDGDSKGVKTGKKKKKNSKKKDKQKNDSSLCATSSSKKACILKKGIEGPDEISTQDSNAFEATSHDVQSSSISTMVVDKLKLSNTRDKSVTVEDDISDGDFDPSPSEEIDREVEEFAQRLILKGPVIYFDSSIQEQLGSHKFPSKEMDP